MKNHSRLLLRAAARIRDQYAARATMQRMVALPRRTWTELQRLCCWREIAGYRGWRFAAERLDRQLERATDKLLSEVNAFLGELRRGLSVAVPTLRNIYDELAALHDEFEHVEIDLRSSSITVRTEPIILEEIDLGPFDIRFEWKRLTLSPPYWVVAVDPRPAGSDSELVHPHIRNATLCEGDGKAPIRKALDECRLCDFFLTVTQVLNTYNAGSPYLSLAHWDGNLCTDCGTVMDEEDECFCPVCHDSVCWDCGSRCEGCEERCCQRCLVTCDDCDEPHCSFCLKSCPICQGDFCADCRDDDGRCAECAGPQTEITEPPPVDAGGLPLPAQTPPPAAASAPETAAAPRAAAPILPDRLGEIAVPA